MVKAYNFLSSWQLFPEKGNYEWGERPRSGIYKLEATEGSKELRISHSWTTLQDQGFTSAYSVLAESGPQPFEDKALADEVQVSFVDSITFELHFYRGGSVVLHLVHEIQPNGYMKLTQQGFREDGSAYTNTEYYHKQMSVLPYSASVSGALVKPTEEGVIRHKALTAMEEQTNMQLDQIRKQIELLAMQAQEIHKRKELSMLIYNAKLSFKPEIGQIYYLYEKNDGAHLISLISPKEWGAGMPYKRCVAGVQLLADHTWRELD
jgi:predicted transcriptional regulator